MNLRKEWNVIPIEKGSKKPLIKWKNYIEERFPREELKDCNYAVICGKISNNLVVLDLDYRHDNKKHFRSIFSKFIEMFPKLARTYVEETPNGHHFFYYIKDDVPNRKLIQDTSKERALKTFQRTTVTNFPYLLKGVDILGENGYCLIAPSKTEDGEYKPLNDFEILTITRDTFNRIVEFFIADEPITSRMRKPFVDILNGTIEIEEQSALVGESEHVYWKYIFVEAWHNLKLQPEDLLPLLEKNQPNYNYRTTISQLNYINFDEQLPLTRESMKRYFPQYYEKKKRGKRKKNENSDDPLWLEIADYLKEKYDIITMKDTEEIMIRKGNIYTLNTEEFYDELGNLLKDEKVGSYTTTRNHIIKYIKDTTRFDRSKFCYEKWIINFKNGYYNVKENKFYDNKYFSDKTFCYEIPHEYKPGIYDCPIFKKVLREWLGKNSKITIDDVFEMMGYTMTMNTNLKSAFFIFGEKNSGKSTFQNILEHVIGENNRASISLQRLCKNEFGTHGLQFKILNMVGDMSDLKIDDVSIFKVLTGGDKNVEAEIKGGSHYQFRNIVKIWYNGNEIPQLQKDDDAFYSRWILINFPNYFPLDSKDTIKDLSDRICQNEMEIQGILHECIKGIKRLYKRGYFRKEIMENSKHIWKYKAEPIYAFLHDECVKDKDGTIPTTEFKERLNKYLFKLNKRPMSLHSITPQLERYNIFRIRETTGDREYVYKGIKWKQKTIFEKFRKV